ncbi:branched-chain amino acid aminotransferase [Citreicella sp. SE45]|nr:branched-chain amino acid aminotransferase [Citreicella sp. SE45]
MTPNSAASSQSYVKDPRNDALESHVDRRVYPRADAGVPVFDAGFVAGDGGREGPQLIDGRLPAIDEHMDRLYERGNAIMPEIGFSREELAEMYRTYCKGA